MAVSARITSVTIDESGTRNVNYDDGTSVGYDNFDDLVLFVERADDETQHDLIQRLILRWWFERDPTLTDTGPVLGKTLTLDMSASEMLKVT